MTTQGRLDLDVTGRSGDFGVNAPAIRLIARRIPAVGPIPVSLIADISSLVAGRVVRLHVTGTTRNPVVQFSPIAQLTTEAVRFIIDQANIPLPAR